MRSNYLNINNLIKNELGMESKLVFTEDAGNADMVTGIVSSAIFKYIASKSDHPVIKNAMASKGDITKVKGYNEAIASMKFVFNNSNGNASLDGKATPKAKKAAELVIKAANILTTNKKDFHTAFNGSITTQSKSVQYIYAGIAAAIVYSASLIVAKCIELNTMPDGTVRPVISEHRIDEVVGSMPISRIQRFVDTVGKGNFKNVLKESAEFDSECLSEAFGFIGAIAASVTIILGLLFIARDIITWVFELRNKAAGWLELQGSLLKLNAARLGSGGVRKAQEGYADKFFSWANTVRVTSDYAEKTAIQDINYENQDVQKAVTTANTAMNINSGGALL